MFNYHETVKKIREHLSTPGNVVAVCNPLKVTYYDDPKYADWFSVGKSGSLYVKSGKKKLCIDGCGIKFGRKR